MVRLHVQLLLDAVDPSRVFFNAPVASVNVADTAVVLEDGTELQARLVVGADGIRSAVSQGLDVPPAQFSGQAGYRGLASFKGTAPAKERTVCQVRFRCPFQVFMRWHMGKAVVFWAQSNGTVRLCYSSDRGNVHALNLFSSSALFYLSGCQFDGPNRHDSFYDTACMALRGTDRYTVHL